MIGNENIPALQANFRAAVIQAVTSAGDNPKDPDIKAQIEILEKEHAIHLEQTGIYISGKNDIPGFRQVVFFGPDHDGNHVSGWVYAIAITSDSRLVSGDIEPVECRTMDERKPIRIEQAIEAILNRDGTGLKFTNNEYMNFNLDDSDSHDQASGSIQSTKHKYMLNSIRQISSHVSRCRLGLDTREEIKHFLYQQIQERYMPARHAIADALDRDILRDMQENDLMELRQCRFLTGGDGASMDVITARQQAVRAYPLLSRVFQKNYRLREAIDAKISLSKTIASLYRVDEGKVKRFSNLTWKQIGSRPKFEKDFSNMIFYFLNLPDKGFPKTVEQFQHIDILEKFGLDLYGDNLIKTVVRLSKNGNPWRFMDRIKQTNGSNVLDAVNFLARKLVVPAMFNRNKYKTCQGRFNDMFYKMNEARDNILNHYKLGELLDWSDRYHRNIARYEDRLDIISVKRDWPGMIGTIDLGNDCCARELTSSEALKVQGRAENHCVGGYVSKILNKEDYSKGQAVLVFSLEENDRISSTVEIRCFLECSAQEQDKYEYEQKKYERDKKYHLRTQICENKAYGNVSPSPMSEDLANRIAVRLEQAGVESFRAYLDGLHEAHAKHNRISKLEHYIVECGLDPFNRSHLETVWEELGRVLPRRFRRDGLDAFIEHGISDASWQKPSPEM